MQQILLLSLLTAKRSHNWNFYQHVPFGRVVVEVMIIWRRRGRGRWRLIIMDVSPLGFIMITMYSGRNKSTLLACSILSLIPPPYSIPKMITPQLNNNVRREKFTFLLYFISQSVGSCQINKREDLSHFHRGREWHKPVNL